MRRKRFVLLHLYGAACVCCYFRELLRGSTSRHCCKKKRSIGVNGVVATLSLYGSGFTKPFGTPPNFRFTNRPFSRFRVLECGRTVSCVKRFPVKTTMAKATLRCHCSVSHCSNNKQRQPYLSFHAFPSFEYDTNKWVHAIRRDQSPSFMILNRHFTDADYTSATKGAICICFY